MIDRLVNKKVNINFISFLFDYKNNTSDSSIMSRLHEQSVQYGTTNVHKKVLISLQAIFENIQGGI